MKYTSHNIYQINLFAMIVLISLFANIYFVSAIEIKPMVLDSTWEVSSAGKTGWNITTLQSFYVINVTGGSAGGYPSKAYITDDVGNIIASADFDANLVAVFSPAVSLSSGTTYRIGSDNNGTYYVGNYRGSFSYPYSDDYIIISNDYDNGASYPNWGGVDYSQLWGIESLGIELSAPTPTPIVITNPSNFTMYDTDSAYYDFDATTSGTVDTWVLDDTTYFAIDSATGEFTNSSVVPVGFYWLNVSVNDSNGYYDSSLFYINVSSPFAPTITNIQNFNMYNNASAYYQFLASNSSALTWALTGSANFQIDSVTGEMTNSSVLAVGTYTMNVSVVDANSLGDSGMFYIYVISPPVAPSETTATALFYIGLIGILIFFLACCIFGFTYFDNLLARVGLFGLGYLLLIAISFVGWECALAFLGTSFIVSAMHIIFIVAVIGAFPVLIGGFAWYLIMLFKVKEIERLMGKGMDMDEAERRTGEKFK